MSLNCLTCQILQRTDSNNERGYVKGKVKERFSHIKVDRTWSGNLNPGPGAFEQMRNDPATVHFAKTNMVKKGHRRLNTIDTTYGAAVFEADVDGEPKLVRSCGMRRDWSFEDLRGTRGGKMSKEIRVR